MSKKLLPIYTKVCLPCVLKKEWQELRQAAANAGYEFEVVRTTYAKELHKEASELWGGEGYIAFVIGPNGEALSIKEARKMFDEIKDKMVKAGKSKPVRKGKKHVQRLRKTKGPIRVDGVEDSPDEIKVEVKA